jgi:RNA polymerase sigma-70 factor (ECF subfamily)
LEIETLYDRYGERLYHYLTIILGSRLDAQDVLQEVFCRLMKNAWRFRLVRNPAGYAFRMARNEAFRFLNKRKRTDSDNIGHFKLPEAIADALQGGSREDAALAAEALAEIPEDQREVILLKIYEDLTFREIASACGISPHTAASRYRYGMEKLRVLIEGQR